MKKIFLLFALSFVFVVGGLAAVLWMQFLNSPASNEAVEIVYDVAPGKAFSTVAHDLEAKKVISNAALFSFYARLTHDAQKMKVGEYLFRTNMTPSEVMNVLVSGKSIGRNFTISEGLNMFEVAELFQHAGLGTRDEFLKLVQDPQFVQSQLGEARPSLEGYLFPETYQVTKYTEMKSVVQAMVQRFLSVYKEVEPLAKKYGWSRHQVVTMASLIEKETGAPEERPMISSVFHNRLNKGMMLQTDPTILYAKMRKSQTFEIKISRADLGLDDDYNTYKRKGLPPGPIANPGALALQAAVSPAVSEYFYFVSQNNGTHIFSKDYADHAKAVGKFQMDPKARQGKSWRDLKKKEKSVRR